MGAQEERRPLRAALPGSALRLGAADGALLRFGVPAGLLLLAAAGWWWSVRMSGEMTGGMGAMGAMDMGMSLGAFVVAWAAMMAAMMLPAVLPVVRLYGMAATAGRAAPLPFFVAGYLVLWIAIGLPAYFAWQALEAPLAAGEAWAGRLAGATLLAAALWQVTPLKSICLRHCRSPLSFFMRFGQGIGRPLGALRMGLSHGGFCIGCCWALFAVLVAVGTMNLAWMVALTLLIVLERNAPGGERIATAGAAGLALLGAVLVLDPSTLAQVT